MSLILLVVFPLAIQYEKGGWWSLLLPLYLLAFIIDIAANYTELALLTWDYPQAGEYTFSKRLQRLMRLDDWRGSAARKVAAYLNYFDPGHIRE